MKYLELREKITENIFSFLDVVKLFSNSGSQTTKIQLARFAKRGLIKKIKRGLYCFDSEILDELELANHLYQPSYISLETALNYYGIIPDIPQAVTSVCLTTTKKIHTEFGNFYYAKISLSLFWGFYKTLSPSSGTFFNLARKEKALLDYFYLRRINSTADLRLDLKELDLTRFRKYAKFFPKWVQKIKL